MARKTFGGEFTHVVTAPDTSLTGTLRGVVKVVPGASLQFYTTATGGSVVTDYLIDADGDGVFEAPATAPLVSPVTGYLLDFQGPDNVQTLFYDPDPTDTDARRVRLIARDADAGAAVPDASATVKGIVELATTAEAQAGTDTTRAVTPAGLAAAAYDDTAILADIAALEAADVTLGDQVTALAEDVASAVGTGAAGPTTWIWADDATTDATTGAVYRPYMALGDMQLIAPVGAVLVGGAGSGDVTVDLETATAVAGPWTSVFGAVTKPTIASGTRRGFSGGSAGTVIASLPAQSLLRAVCLSAPAGSGGGTMTWRTPVSGGGAETATVTALNIPLPTGRAAGDLMVAVLFINSTGTPTWPSGWNAYGTPFPAGTDATLGPFYMHVATKTAVGSESTVQVTFPSATAVITTLGVANGSLVVPTSSNVAVVGTAATTWSTPSGLTTPSANALVVHLAMPRWTSGNTPSTITWDGSLSTDTQAQTNRTAAANVGIAVAHLTQASAGAVAVRTATGTAQARALTTTLVFTGSSGTTAKGLQVQASVRAA